MSSCLSETTDWDPYEIHLKCDNLNMPSGSKNEYKMLNKYMCKGKGKVHKVK